MFKFKSDPIPVKLYVKRFVENGHFNKSFILDVVYRLFNKTEGLESDQDIILSEYEHLLSFPLPDRIFNHIGWKLTRKNVVAFNNIAEGYIKDRFECELEANIRRSIRDESKFHIQQMILDLRQKFHLDESDLPLETIRKSVQRFCDREHIDLQQIKIFNKSVPKKAVKPLSNSHISQKHFLKIMAMGESTFFRRKEKNTLNVVVEKFYGRNYIRIDSLPAHLLK